MTRGLLIITTLILVSCRRSGNPERLIQSLDTNKIIAQANIQESAGVISDSLKVTLAVYHLKYIQFACDCPDFVVESSKDSIGQYRETYYVEAASDKVAIPDILMHSSNAFEFYGKVCNESGFPKNARMQDPEPEPGRVLKYWSYRVKKPYMFWGPKYKVVSDNDTIELTASIQVH